MTDVLIDGGTFVMGSDRYYPDEAPSHQQSVDRFRLSVHPVTNADFAAFVDETGYVTGAERVLDTAQFPELTEAERAPGSLVFTPTNGPVDLRNWRAWWRWTPGADWRHPAGPSSDVRDHDRHPVVQVDRDDADAYARWVGGRLPTEREWEFAAKAGTDPAWPYAWGGEDRPGGRLMANTWQGAFPYRNTGADGWMGTSPVGSFPANPLGLVDMIGNVWEWTSTPYRPHDPRGHHTDDNPGHTCGCGPSAAAAPEPLGVLKGGSHLCAPEYCLRYRPSARSAQSPDSATSHIGFRVAFDT